MKKILKYTLSLLLAVMLVNPVCSQAEVNTQAGVGGPGPGMRVRGTRIGIDLASLALLYFDPGRMSYNISVDYEAWQDIYPVLEFGYQTVNLEEENYSYNSNGFFGRAGVDVNLLKYEQTNVYEMFYVGFRYGMSYFTQRADNIMVADDYFGGLVGGAVAENQLNAHWISLVGGVRAELFNNFFMGWSILGNLKLAQTHDSNMQPYYVPGFGKGDRRAGVIFTYTLAYRIPLQTYKPRKIITRAEPTEASESIPLRE